MRRALHLGLWALALGHVVEALVLRRRARQLVRLPHPGPGAEVAAGPADVVAVEGAVVDGPTLAAVTGEMEARDLEASELKAPRAQVVDLVPGDLPAYRALRMLRRVEPDRILDDPLYTRSGAHEVVVCDPSVTKRIAERPGSAAELSGRLDRGHLVRYSSLAQRYAPGSSLLRVAPTLRAAPGEPRDRWRELAELSASAKPRVSLAPGLLALEAAHLAVMTGGLLIAPPAALAALATWCTQPLVVFGAQAPKDLPVGGAEEAGEDGCGLKPPHLARACLLRLPAAWFENVRTGIVGWREARSSAAARAAEPIPVPPPAAVLFDPRQEMCPWCATGPLTGRIDTTDLLQNKPGTFHLDECVECGHIFQNPPLSLRGLDYYYDQFYDGAGEEAADVAFAGMGRVYRRRADAVARFAEPTAWLDVGTGHGHFCLATRERWPDCRFDGLDISESIDEALRRGWIEHGYRGLFPDLAGRLRQSYDVVSMHHYLEHTREPRAEIRAAAQVLRRGGHLMIEVPDPASPWSRWVGRYWLPWFQPQHQHLMPCENLTTALTDDGFEVLSVERGPATMGGDAVMASALLVQRLVPSPHVPWRPPATTGRQVARVATIAAVAPLLATAAVTDLAKDAWHRRPGSTSIGNAYRVVARRL